MKPTHRTADHTQQFPHLESQDDSPSFIDPPFLLMSLYLGKKTAVARGNNHCKRVHRAFTI